MVILGGSGSGKSTLLRTLVGLERPSSGEIWLKGKNIASISSEEMDEIRNKIGMSFQASAFLIAACMVLIDKGNVVAIGSTEEMRSSAHPRVRQFLDRIAEPAVSEELDYLQILTEEHRHPGH